MSPYHPDDMHTFRIHGPHSPVSIIEDEQEDMSRHFWFGVSLG